MNTFGVSWALARRRAAYAIAVIAAVLCGLSSVIMQELAYGQRESEVMNRTDFRQEAERCRKKPSAESCVGVIDGSYRAAEESFKRSTDQLGARAKPLQSPLGAIRYAQSWLLTLVGLVGLIVAIGVTVASDRERGRFLTAWRPDSRGNAD